jgi:integrase/recombinase XerD
MPHQCDYELMVHGSDDIGNRMSTVHQREPEGHYSQSSSRPGTQDFRSRGCLCAAELRPEDIDAYLLSMRDRGLAGSTVTPTACLLRNFGRWLEKAGLVLSDPTICIDIDLDDEPLLAAPLSEAQVAALLDSIPQRCPVDLRNRAFLEILYGCGLRMREVLNATLDDLDRRAQTLLVTGKFGHQRIMPVMPSAMAAMEDCLTVRQGFLHGPDRGILFLSEVTGKGMKHNSVGQWLRRMGRRVLGDGVRVHPHAFRHAAAVHLLRGGADIRIVQEFLGHLDLDSTKTYLRLVPGHLRLDYDRAKPALA